MFTYEFYKGEAMKNTILKTMTFIVCILLYLFVSYIETNITIGTIDSLLCLAYLYLFAMANDWGNRYKKHE